MNDRRTEIIVGAFVTLALIGLTLGVIWGKNLKLFSRRQHLILRFENIRGLEEGDPVMVRGIEKGAVKSVHLGENSVDVTLWLDKDVRLYTDFQGYIESKELMGGKQITLEPGSSSTLASLNQVYSGDIRGDLNILFMRTEQTLVRLDSLLIRTSDVITPEKIERILTNMEEATDQTQQLVQETRQPLQASLAHLRSVSEQLDEDSTAARVALLIARLDTTARTFHQIGQRIEAQQGTLGQLVHDRQLYDRVLLTSQRLDSLIFDVKKNPKKYLHVSVF